jgi:hypothetical protein
LPLDLEELNEKIIKFNIKILKQCELIEKDLDNDKMYKDLITGKIDIPECNYISGKGKVPIYIIVNRISKFIYQFNIKKISESHILLPEDISKHRNSSHVTDIILETFNKEELSIYLNDLLLKYIKEYIKIVEENFPILKKEMPYYNLFKNGCILELYILKKEKDFFGKYSSRLAYCFNNDSTDNKIIVNICDEKEIPEKPEYRCYSYTRGSVGYLLLDNYINNEFNRHMVLSNMIYSLIKTDIENVIKNNEYIFE